MQGSELARGYHDEVVAPLLRRLRCPHAAALLGARTITARLADVAVHLGLLLGRRWAPYPKWRGTAFAALDLAVPVQAALSAALAAPAWPAAEEAVAEALDGLYAVQTALGLPGPPRAVVRFHDRPFRGVDDDVAAALTASIDDWRVRALPRGVGSAEQWVDAVDVLVDPHRRLAAVRAQIAVAEGAGTAPGPRRLRAPGSAPAPR